MNLDDSHHEIVFRSHHRGACMELRLVLESAEITNQVSHQAGEWFLIVAESDATAAFAELAAYRKDNPLKQPIRTERVRVYGGAIAGAFIYAALLIAFGRVTLPESSQETWNAIGRMNSGQVMDGQVWRIVTALTLHADAEHLMSNVAFGSVFGLMAGRILGGGVGWLTILLAGAIGNGLNALMREPDHSSIGASTAVFAAIGVMVAHALHPRFATADRLLKRWSPLIGGVLLLAMIGVGGERTDVGAHVTGFVGGVMLGWLAARLPHHWLTNNRVQVLAGVAAIAIVAVAWAIAIGTV
ncbi:rhomboid family intramembrane serine protease [Planctomycetes bacterium K23_9]|uniref:Rhomboid family protein n=1 Tax=Stieleria marina TaxID=1930275 RepID=A0A517NWM1_9BACT|nr:Rhomboid family protein [Planctomycetes bacterium K23_9]